VKKIAVLPTLLTLGNGVCGFVAITFAAKILSANDLANLALLPDGSNRVAAAILANEANFAWAGWFILLGMLFDMLDGYVARLSKTASDFGGELDSLCDVVTFGVTPAFLLLKLGPDWTNPFLHQCLAGIAALYFSCTALRLARFNVENDPDPANHKRFRGLPSPGAAGCIAALAILRGEFPATLDKRWQFFGNIDIEAARLSTVQAVEIMAPIIALIISLLMVSNVPYPHLTGKIFRGKKHIGHLIQVLLAAFILLLFRSLAPLLVFWGFAFAFPLLALLARNRPVEERALPNESPSPADHQSPKQN
jgi:CDP-diacylglycerol--serine O-phosphatidyltransferase